MGAAATYTLLLHQRFNSLGNLCRFFFSSINRAQCAIAVKYTKTNSKHTMNGARDGVYVWFK